MSSVAPSLPIRDPLHRNARSFIWALAMGLFWVLASRAGASTKAQTGQWSPEESPVTFQIVHMALLPSGGTYHSRIVVWDYQDIHAGAEFGWNAGAAGCDDWPYSLARLDTSWNPPVQIVFAGHAQPANSRGLLTVGGWEDLTSSGIPDAVKLTPGSGSSSGTWTARADMQQSRQSPTLTPLRDGRMLVTGGMRYAHEWYFGGRVDGNPPTGGTGDSLHRFGSGAKRIWDPPVKPIVTANESDRPSPREGHTAASLQLSTSFVDFCQAFFGGKDASGHTDDNDVHLLKREDGGALDADYTYRWSKLAVSGNLPPARSDHVAMDLGGGPAAMAIYGGLRHPSGDTTTVLPDFWKLSYDAVNLQWHWSPLDTSGGPGPRYGHAAVRNGHLMYLFGGSGAPGADPTDNKVYEFNLSTNQWRALPTAAGPAPKPRRDHAMVGTLSSSILMYGGYLSGSASSDTLWKLVSGDSATWSVIATSGSSPGPRANHSAFFDGTGSAGRLTIFGGDSTRSGDPGVDNYAYSIQPFPSTGSPTWMQEAAASYRLSGHTVVGDPFAALHARIPEIYNPDSDTWTQQSGSGWMPPSTPPFNLIREYPVQFLVPGSSIPSGGGRVLRVGQDPKTRYFDLPATGLVGAWQDAATNVISGDTLRPVTGVQYLPGKILVVGNGPEDDDPEPDDHARTFDATAIGTAIWVDADPQDQVIERSNVNLLVLPNGQVMVLGSGYPQIWDPSNGSWTDPLDFEGLDRGYRSTAMLLPDGRVLTGGGFAGGGTSLQAFCPPYLFSGDNLAQRPTITTVPDSVVYGEAFVIGKSVSDAIGSACLIRPAAVTHGFDQNGRYVPLTFETIPGDTLLQTWAPTEGSVAPPGDYMLFILNTQGVPAVAKWIHLGACAQIPCDAGAPPKVTDMYADIVTPTDVWMVWSAPGDDKTPLAGSYDLRISTSGIANDLAYAAATPLTDEPAVQSQGTPVNYTVDSLSACTQYHFALKTRDGASPFKNWSLLSNMVTVTTTCGGGPSGGSRAERVDEGRVAGGASARAVASSKEAVTPEAAALSDAGAPSAGLAALSSLDAGSGVLEAETRRTREGGGWQVILRRLAEAQGVEAADRDAIVSQVRDASGAWRTLGRYRPAPGQYPLGLCALRDNGRVVFPAGYAIDQVAPGLRSRGQECAMSAADHSRSGAMSGSFLAEGGAVEMQVGDVLTVTYDPTGTRPSNEMSAYLQVHSSGQSASLALASGRRLGTPLPTSYALYQNHPNPFGGSTTIDFDLPVPGAVRLEVFDLLGRRVATLAQGEYPAGSHTVAWDLRSAGGAPVRAGVYMYRLQSGTFSARRKLSVVP